MIKRYLVSTSGKNFFITKFYINKIEDVLRFGYDIFAITNNSIASMINTIDQSFINNPESDNIFNKLSVEKKFSRTISQLESLDVIHNLEKVLRENSYDNYLRVELPQAVLFYELNKVKLLHNFIKHFYENYEFIKSEFNKPSEQPVVESKNEFITEVKDLSSKLFYELIKLSPNNLVTFFIFKQLTIIQTNQKVDFKLAEDQDLEIDISKFTNNLMLLYNDLNVLINYIPQSISNDDYRNLIKMRLSTLIKLVITIYENQTKLIKNDTYLYLNFIIILIYIYGYWLNESEINANNLYNFVNKIIVITKGNITKFKSIKFKPLSINLEEETIQVELDKINKLSIKYKYLIDIDRSRFIKHILNDLKSINENDSTKIEKKLILNKPKLLDLSNLPLPLTYNLINDDKLSSHIIISKPYHSLLILENSANIFQLDNIDEMLPKLIDIISKIIIILRKNIEIITLNPSTLLIYNDYIEPNINENLLSIKEKLYILYDIIIPFLHDTFKINKFIDYFH